VTADLAIKHVVLLMMENHSFDQMLGSPQDHSPDLEGINIGSPSARFNIDSSGNEVLQIPTDELTLGGSDFDSCILPWRLRSRP
jgi:phospholipase C